MHRRFARLALSTSAALMFACATTGREFAYHERSNLALGRTTEEQARALMGKPELQKSISTQDGDFTVLRYFYSLGNLNGVSVRISELEFKNGVLNAYSHASGFREDSSDFDLDASTAITVGSSTVAEVVELVGEPAGKANCPSVLPDYKYRCERGVAVWMWAYFSKAEGLSTKSKTQKLLLMTFDGEGRVADLQSNPTGNKPSPVTASAQAGSPTPAETPVRYAISEVEAGMTQDELDAALGPFDDMDTYVTVNDSGRRVVRHTFFYKGIGRVIVGSNGLVIETEVDSDEDGSKPN